MAKFYKKECSQCKEKFKIYYDEIERDLCEDCINKNENERIFQQSKTTMANALNEKNREAFLAMDRWMQEYLIDEALNDGIIKWTIKGRDHVGA